MNPGRPDFRRAVGGCLPLLAALSLLTACGRAHPAATHQPQPPSASPTARLQRSAVGQTVPDPVRGGAFTVLSVVRGFRPPTPVGGAVVLVELRGTSGERFAAGSEASGFTLVGPGGIEPVSTEVPAAALVSAGFAPLAGQPPAAGRSMTGWLPFVLDAGAATTPLRLDYRRPGFVVTGSLVTIPPLSAAVALPGPS